MEGRVAIVFVTRSGMRVAATMPDPQHACGSVDPLKGAGGDRRRQHGRTVQVHVRATARPNGVHVSVSDAPGTWSKPKNPFACGTRALSRVRGFCFAVCFRHTGPCACTLCVRTWRRGRGETSSRSARPFGTRKTKRRPAALGPDNTRGDDVRLQVADTRNRAV